MTRRQFLLSAAIVLLAFLVREWHVLASVLPNPTQGDVASYLRYALHMVWDGVYSQANEGEPVLPDAYRGPGYPLLLAAIFRFTGLDGWYPAIYQVQALLGTATVALTIALARRWLPFGWAALVGLLLALQPHHIAASNAMLTEVLFGFLIVLGLLLATMRASVGAGAVFGYAYLVNPVIAGLPVVLLALHRRFVVVLLVMLVAVVGWGARNALHGAEGGSRGWQNLVQGSWPEYHKAQVWWPWKPDMLAARDAIVAEQTLIVEDKAAGLRSIGDRLAADPLRFARWYASKPYLLWEWDIRMGKGGHYTLDVRESPLDKDLVLSVIFAWAINPLLFALSLVGAWAAWRGDGRIVVVAFLYFTAVHVVLQAEPRYAIPYRALELMLAVSAAAWASQRWRPVAAPAAGTGDTPPSRAERAT